ncbi:MAG: N-acetyl-gamma-glutamyl-phosphate reductase [Clostridia bacterium]|nr:N-acetyl-gamma-glutamyl-phosphate reductase [Clostridia bacterium]
MIKVFIVGGAGTTGLRLQNRLQQRDDIELLTICEEKRKDTAEIRKLLEKADYAFLCLPDDAARETAALCEDLPVRVLDASTTHRTDPDWAYGFPELSALHYTNIKNAKRVAVPGCHASGFISLVYPLIAAGALSKSALLSATSLTGYSGGGKKMIAEYESECLFEEMKSPKLYGLAQTHKHLPEMTAQCSLDTAPMFLPVVDDFYSGMLVTVPLHAQQLAGKYSVDDLRRLYAEYYSGSKLIHVCDEPHSALYTNSFSGRDDMEISVSGSDGRIVLSSRFDNLGKGASGAAIECFNIMCSLPEETGLHIG